MQANQAWGTDRFTRTPSHGRACNRGFLAAMSACRVMGRRLLQEEQLGAAIWWGVKSRDAAFTSHLAHKVRRRGAHVRDCAGCTGRASAVSLFYTVGAVSNMRFGSAAALEGANAIRERLGRPNQDFTSRLHSSLTLAILYVI